MKVHIIKDRKNGTAVWLSRFWCLNENPAIVAGFRGGYSR